MADRTVKDAYRTIAHTNAAGALQLCIKTAERNLEDNDVAWEAWFDSEEIAEASGVTISPEAHLILDRAIETNGVSLIEDLPAIQVAVAGQMDHALAS